jgi:hypothetical protein
MKKFLFAALLAWANTISAQTAEFAIDVAGPDSMFLVQRRIDAPTADAPRPAVIVTQSLFKNWAELSAFVDKIRRDARAESDKAKAALETAKKLEEAADKIEAAAQAAKSPPQQKKQ